MKNRGKPKPLFVKAAVENVKDCADDVESTVAKISDKSRQQGIRLREFFRDFDKLRSGNVTSSQFRSALNMGHIPIAEKEFQMLCEHYKSSKGTFHYRSFCDACEGCTAGWTKASQVDAEEAAEVISDLRNFSMNRKVSIKELFADIDRHNRKVVTKIALRRVLKGINWDASDHQMDILCSFYENPCDKSEVK